jgi:hypothetical protein
VAARVGLQSWKIEKWWVATVRPGRCAVCARSYLHCEQEERGLPRRLSADTARVPFRLFLMLPTKSMMTEVSTFGGHLPRHSKAFDTHGWLSDGTARRRCFESSIGRFRIPRAQNVDICARALRWSSEITRTIVGHVIAVVPSGQSHDTVIR